MTKTKTCSKCGKEKPLAFFYFVKKGSPEREACCGACKRKANNARYKKNRYGRGRVTYPDADWVRKYGGVKS